MKSVLLLALLPLAGFAVFAASQNEQATEKERVEAAMPQLESTTQKHRILCFSKPYGFRHKSIEIGETMLQVMAEKTGLFEVTFSNDLANFEPDAIKAFDAICFNNNTHIQKGFKDESLRESLLNYVKSGGGIFAIHSATDGGWPGYVEMIGGTFRSHPWTSGGTWDIANEDPDHPIVAKVHGGKDFALKDELYVYQNYDRAEQRVLLAVDVNSEVNAQRKGPRKDQDYALAWIKKFGKGRVFVSSLGHNKEVFYNPEILKMWVEGFRYVLGEIDVETAAIPKPESNLPE